MTVESLCCATNLRHVATERPPVHLDTVYRSMHLMSMDGQVGYTLAYEAEDVLWYVVTYGIQLDDVLLVLQE